MNRFRTSLAIAASVGLVLGSVPALAQAGAQVSAQQAVTVWSDALKGALPIGYWEGTFEEFDEAGKLVASNAEPECLTETSRDEMVSQIVGPMSQVVQMADCTAVSGGAGSLALTLECKFGADKSMKFVSSGTHGDGAIDLKMAFSAQGADAPDLGGARMNGRRTRAC